MRPIHFALHLTAAILFALPACQVPAALPASPALPLDLTDRLKSTAIDRIELKDRSADEALALWRQALLHADPGFGDLGILLPGGTARRDLILPTGISADESLKRLLEAYACECRQGPRHLTIRSCGGAFAEDGNWIACALCLPFGRCSGASPETWLNFWRKQGLRLPEGSRFDFIPQHLCTLLQERDLDLMQKRMRSGWGPGSGARFQCRLELVWLKTPDLLADLKIDLDELAARLGVQVESAQTFDAHDGSTATLVWRDAGQVKTFKATASYDEHDNQVTFDDLQMKLKPGESRILEEHVDGPQGYRSLWLRLRASPAGLNRCFSPRLSLGDLKVHGADAAFRSHLSQTAFVGGEGELAGVLHAWLAAQGIPCREEGPPHRLDFAAIGPLSAELLLRELSFRGQVQASWQAGSLRLIWPRCEASYRLPERDEMVYDFESFSSPPWTLKVSNDRLDLSFNAPQVQPYFQLVAERINALYERQTQATSLEVYQVPREALKRLQLDHPCDAELQRRLAATPAATLIHRSEENIPWGESRRLQVKSEAAGDWSWGLELTLSGPENLELLLTELPRTKSGTWRRGQGDEGDARIRLETMLDYSLDETRLIHRSTLGDSENERLAFLRCSHISSPPALVEATKVP